MQDPLTTIDLGRMGYGEALALQERMVEARAAGEIGDTLLLVEHEPVLTAGRGTTAGSVLADDATLRRRGLDVVPVSRGGDVTWHGPGQLVGYPICHLDRHGRDLHRFLRGLESALVATLNRWRIEGHPSGGRTGVWVGERKIASIGIAVRKWVTWHGFALNVNPDLSDFELIHPCGLVGVRMTTMSREAGQAPDFAEVRSAAASDVARCLGYTGVQPAPAAARRHDATGAAA